ncbi:MAG: 18S rRNA maturation protein [Bogoriella megaspora]|nr:MAG: 18S rRNA maturation protein [Bogoriella megaspora]
MAKSGKGKRKSGDLNISQPYKRPGNKPGPHPMGASRPRRPAKISVNPLKDRIRDIKRVLGHSENLPANQKVDLERELASLEYDVQTAQSERRKQEIIGRYHMVRFFGMHSNLVMRGGHRLIDAIDRQKATRRLKKAHKEANAATNPEDKTAAQKRVRIAEVDLNYAIYYPLGLPYVSLFPTKKGQNGKIKGDEELTEQGVSGDQEMWHLVEGCMTNNTLEDLRNGKLTQERNLKSKTAEGELGVDKEYGGVKKGKLSNGGGKKSKKKPAGYEDEDLSMDGSDDESDGGFFE